MLDEFTTEHGNVRIEIFAIIFIPVPVALVFVAGTMKRIRGAMDSDEPFSVVNRIQERLFPGGTHWWFFVRSFPGKIPGCVKEERVKLRQILGREEAAILGKGE